MPKEFLARFRNSLKGVWVDTDATEGAVVGENLFIRETDGSLSLFEPSSGVVTPASGTPTTVTITPAGTSTGTTDSVGGSNSGYAQAISPAAAPTNYDLDASMINGLNNPQFPTLNYVLVGNGVEWVAVPMTGDASIVASGVITVNRAATLKYYGTASGTNTYAATMSPGPALSYTDGDLFLVLLVNAPTGPSTLNINGIGAKGLKQNHIDLVSGQYAGNALIQVRWSTGDNYFSIVGESLPSGGSSSNVLEIILFEVFG